MLSDVNQTRIVREVTSSSPVRNVAPTKTGREGPPPAVGKIPNNASSIGPASAIVMALAGSTSAPLALLAAHLRSTHPRGLLLAASLAGVIAALAVLALRRMHFPYRVVGPTVMVSLALLMNGNDLTNRFGLVGAVSIWAGVSLLLLITLNKAPDRVVYRSLSWALCAFFFSWPLTNLNLSSPAPLPGAVREIGPDANPKADVIVIVLDGFASPAVTASSFGEELAFVRRLEAVGFTVPDLAWAPSTRTELSVGSYLEQELLQLPDKNVLRGDGSLLGGSVAQSHRISYVESGWYGTVCGSSVDVCYQRYLVDDSVQAVIDLNLLNQWTYTEWGHAFGNNALRAMRDARTGLEEIQRNEVDDFLFAHILMPHEPYMFDSSCNRVPVPIGLPDGQPVANDREKAAYHEQAACVGRLLVEFSEAVDPNSIVVIAGDHGTTFGGQMYRPAVDWTEPEVLERGSTFLAYRLPTGCETPSGSSTMEALSMAIECGTGLSLQQSTPQLWLSPYVGPGICLDTRTLERLNAC